uniref:Uncharacterized protein n=1 Tax=Sphaerodactylus townsendi TaxID=933632 RepID=A0ACB8F681_9SAUR
MARERSRGAPAVPLVAALLLLLLLLLLRGAAAQPVSFHADGNGHSLHPPYFNLAEGTRISATATCGEEDAGAKSPRPVEDLYCKLVGGPVAGGDPNQTIQVAHPSSDPKTEPEPPPAFARCPSRCVCVKRAPLCAISAMRGRSERTHWLSGAFITGCASVASEPPALAAR